jgi:hypothetical protein
MEMILDRQGLDRDRAADQVNGCLRVAPLKGDDTQ